MHEISASDKEAFSRLVLTFPTDFNITVDHLYIFLVNMNSKMSYSSIIDK